MQTLQTNQPNEQDNQKFSSKRARPKNFLRGSEPRSRETGHKIRNCNSCNRSRADNRRTNCDSGVQSPTPEGENRSRIWSHESRAEQSKTAVSFDREKCCRCGQRNHASKECRNCFECGSPNHFKQNFAYLNEN